MLNVGPSSKLNIKKAKLWNFLSDNSSPRKSENNWIFASIGPKNSSLIDYFYFFTLEFVSRGLESAKDSCNKRII